MFLNLQPFGFFYQDKKNPLSQRKIIEQGNQFVLLVFDSFCHSGVKLIPLYFTNRICHSGARHYRLMDFPELSSSIFPKFSPWDLKFKQQLRRLFLTIQCTAVGHYPPPENALIKYPLFLLKLFSLAIFLPSFQSIWKLQSLAEKAAIASYDMFDGELLMQYKYFSILQMMPKVADTVGFKGSRAAENDEVD